MGKGAKADGGGAKGSSSVVAMWVSRARAGASLLGFAIVTYVSRGAGMGWTDAAYHGLIGAVAFSFVGWFCALLVITGLMRTAARDVTAPVTRRATAGAPEALPPPSVDAG
ncbi:MAG: hypothetical protein AB1416_11365 [Actinomycetota bacterium]